jgi:large subunit ribosomal protein L25
MAVITRIPASRRSEQGSTACRRLRQQGFVPANVYGHKQEAIPISLKEDDIRPIIASGAHVVELDLSGKLEQALIREVQWDTYSTYVRHLDFVRVDANERVKVTVPVQLRGTAPGALAGGILEQPLHALHVECLAIQIPDFIPVRIASLDIGGAVHVKELTDLPEGVKVLDHPEALIVHVVKPGIVEAAPTEAAPGPAEPELIGRVKKEEEESEED